jgi:hypothetical protein
MKLLTLALATALTMTSTFAFAQTAGVGGYGSVTQPSVGSYTAPVGTSNVVPTWRNTGPAAPMPHAPTMNSFARTGRAAGTGVRGFR